MGGQASLENLSTARDTQLMQELLRTTNKVINVKDAGTAMRFLTAYFAVSGQSREITGTERMQERPIGHLVEALQTIGAKISYTGMQGFPPLAIHGFDRQETDKVSIKGDISSQFISALMMIAPALPNGLTISLVGKVSSRPYLVMTAELMTLFGVPALVGNESIRISSGSYQPVSYRVEEDWSAASYWFAFAALGRGSDILLPKVKSQSLQGDRVIVEMMEKLGVSSSFSQEGLRVKVAGTPVKVLTADFSDCPDLAQTVLPVCAGLGIEGSFTGMESLRIKETDRIVALRTELAKIGTKLSEENGTWHLLPGNPSDIPKELTINTYHDHRMAMGFAPLSMMTNLTIENPAVVEKSYPSFWEDMKGLGFQIT
jgi:3-phosphoshikimate 1-carboxyvinyltransferase